MKNISHIHHISAIVGNTTDVISFYQDILRLRLVKQTVNFDDPSHYHLYFANQAVEDGTLLTFFPWENKPSGQKGSGQLGRIAFKVPNGALNYWKNRLIKHKIDFTEDKWLNKTAIFFQDNHKLELALVEGSQTAHKNGILGFDGLEMIPADYLGSFYFMKHTMSLTLIAETDAYFHFQTLGTLKHNIILPKINVPRGFAWAWYRSSCGMEYIRFRCFKKLPPKSGARKILSN